MITTREYRAVFNQIAKEMGVQTSGTWTDDINGMGGTQPDQRMRHVTHAIQHNTPALIEHFVHRLRQSVTGCDLRLTATGRHATAGKYIKATCEIYKDIWDK